MRCLRQRGFRQRSRIPPSNSVVGSRTLRRSPAKSRPPSREGCTSDLSSNPAFVAPARGPGPDCPAQPEPDLPAVDAARRGRPRSRRLPRCLRHTGLGRRDATGGRARHGGRADACTGRLGHGEDRRVGQLDALPRLRRGDPDLSDPRGVQAADRHRRLVRRGHRRQRHVLRQDPGPARQRPGHRQGHRRVHRLDGRPDGQHGIHPAAGQGQDSERGEPAPPAAERRLRPGSCEHPDLADRVRRHRLEQGAGARRPAHRLGPVEPRAARAASRCSTSIATRSA